MIPANQPETAYDEREISFRSGDITLAGTLTLPMSRGPHPAIVLIAGSGAQTRDADALGFKPFGIMADHLARRGVAVLRYDKRGSGSSTGDFTQATLADFAGDALAAARLLQEREGVDPSRVGLCGHSEGGAVAYLATSRSTDIAFLVLMSAFAVPVETLDRIQAEAMGRASGTSEAEIQKLLSLQRSIHEAARAGEFGEQLKSDLDEQTAKTLQKLPEKERPPVETVVEMQLRQLQSPGYRYLLEFDPAQALSKVRCPVLALFGALDTAVPEIPNREEIVEALQAGGNPDYSVISIPRANHFFMEARTGAPEEIPQLEKRFVLGFLDTVTEWILQKSAPAKKRGP